MIALRGGYLAVVEPLLQHSRAVALGGAATVRRRPLSRFSFYGTAHALGFHPSLISAVESAGNLAYAPLTAVFHADVALALTVSLNLAVAVALALALALALTTNIRGRPRRH